MTANLILISYSQMKLCLFKVAKSDACIKPLSRNPVKVSQLLFLYLVSSWNITLINVMFYEDTRYKFC